MARYQEDLEWVKSLCLGRHVLWKLLDITDTWSCLCPLVDRSQRNDYSLAMKCAHRIYSLRDGVCCFRFWFSVPCYFVFFSEQQEGHLPEILRHFWDCLQNGKTTRGARARAQVGTPRGDFSRRTYNMIVTRCLAKVPTTQHPLTSLASRIPACSQPPSLIPLLTLHPFVDSARDPPRRDQSCQENLDRAKERVQSFLDRERLFGPGT